jgi:hypothetical protein
MEVPIACTLDAADAQSQLAQWQALLATTVIATERPLPTELLYRLRGDLAGLAELVRLAQREKECCAFFDFALLIDAGSLALQVSVPPAAVAVLDRFEGLASAR